MATNVDVSFDTLYIKMKSGDLRAISTMYGSQINFLQSYNVGDAYSYSQIFF